MAHFEDCKFFRRKSCFSGPDCMFRHNELACLTVEVCRRWASGYVCDGRCNLRHPSVAELAAMEATAFKPQIATLRSASTTASAPVCKFFQQGRCTKGSSCLFSHETPRQKEQPAWDESATATVAPPRPERKSPPLTLRTAAAKARAAASSTNAEADVEQATDAVEKGDGASRETGTMKTDVKAKAAEILERHRLSKRSRVEAGRLKTNDAPPTRQRSLQGSGAASSAGRGAAGVSTESVDRPGRTKRQRSPERGSASEEAEDVRGMPTESADLQGTTKRQMYQDNDDAKTGVKTLGDSAKDSGQSFSTACPEGDRVKVSCSEMASGIDGQGDVATSATTSSPTYSPPSPHSVPPATIST